MHSHQIGCSLIPNWNDEKLFAWAKLGFAPLDNDICGLPANYTNDTTVQPNNTISDYNRSYHYVCSNNGTSKTHIARKVNGDLIANKIVGVNIVAGSV